MVLDLLGERGGAWLLCDYQAGDEFDQGFTTPSQYLKELHIYGLIDFMPCMNYHFFAQVYKFLICEFALCLVCFWA